MGKRRLTGICTEEDLQVTAFTVASLPRTAARALRPLSQVPLPALVTYTLWSPCETSACWHRVLSYLCPPVYTSHHNFKKTVGSSREHAPWAVTVRIQKKNSGVNGSHLGGSVSCLQFLCFQRNRPESICQTAMRIRRRKASRITESKATHQ